MTYQTVSIYHWRNVTSILPRQVLSLLSKVLSQFQNEPKTSSPNNRIFMFPLHHLRVWESPHVAHDLHIPFPYYFPNATVYRSIIRRCWWTASLCRHLLGIDVTLINGWSLSVRITQSQVFTIGRGHIFARLIDIYEYLFVTSHPLLLWDRPRMTELVIFWRKSRIAPLGNFADYDLFRWPVRQGVGVLRVYAVGSQKMNERHSDKMCKLQCCKGWLKKTKKKIMR